MKLIITRHGETEWNLRRMTQGVTNTRLTLRGIQQAKRLAERLADAPIEYIYSSPLLRAANTAGYIRIKADGSLAVAASNAEVKE